MRLARTSGFSQPQPTRHLSILLRAPRFARRRLARPLAVTVLAIAAHCSWAQSARPVVPNAQTVAQPMAREAGTSSPNPTLAFWAHLPSEVRAKCPLSSAVLLSDNESPPLQLDSEHTLAQLETERETASNRPAASASLGDAGPEAAQPRRTSQEMGVYRASSALHTRAPMVHVNLGNGLHLTCMPAVEILLTLSPSISIARELPDQSCPQQEVYTHEMGHYQIDRQAIEQWEEESAQWNGSVSGLYLAASDTQAQQEAEASAAALAHALAQRLAALREPAQRAHDSPEEYARLSASCGGQTAAIAQRAVLHRLIQHP